MPQRNVNLTDHFDHFIDAHIESGRFSNASEMVREALRLLDRGDYTALHSGDEIDFFMKDIHEEVSSALAADGIRP